MLRHVLSAARQQNGTQHRVLVAVSSSSSSIPSRPWSQSNNNNNNNNSSNVNGTASRRHYSVFTWGTNKNGTLLSSTVDNIVWEPHHPAMDNLPLDENKISSIVCGPTDTAVVLDDGSVYVCGTNKNGQLGLGHTNPVPTLTPLPDDLPPIQRVALGPTMGALIAQETGDLYTCGFGGSIVAGMGCLGHGHGDSITEFKLVESVVEDGCSAKDVELGESSMTVLTTEGEILTTGASSYGRLGNGETSVDSLYLEPVEVLQSAKQIASGKSFTLALSPDGIVYGWGRNHKGQLGTGFGMAVDMYSMESVPVPLDSDELMNRTVTKIAAGANHAACVTSSGELFTWGMQLHLEPVRVNEVLHTKIVDVVCGNDYTMALSEDHHIYVWGRGGTGVLGLGSGNKKINQAQIIKTLASDKVIAMSAGWAHAACLVEKGANVVDKIDP